jgi:hypothetical protein
MHYKYNLKKELFNASLSSLFIRFSITQPNPSLVL